MSSLPDATLAHLKEVLAEPAEPPPDLSRTSYELRHLLGAGGMGTVYLAWDRTLERDVALKVLNANAPPELGRRLLREARTLARLEHPGIVPVHEVGALPDDRVYYVMKRVRGATLADHAAAVTSLSERLGIFERVCDAVNLAHAHGVVHRDLKPDNVMIGRFGEVLVLDWGVAQVGAARSEAAILGTRGFMAPEQERGEDADARTDVSDFEKKVGSVLTEEEREQDIDTLARSDSLAELERRDPRQAQVVQLRFFGGFMMAEIADYLNVSCGTAKYDL